MLKTEDTSMKKLTNFFKHLSKKMFGSKNESGQGATEYILLLVVIVGLVLMFGPKIKEIIGGKVDQLSGMINEVKP